MNIKETRTIRHEKVRTMCIQNDLYTCGTNEEYAYLLFTLCDNSEETTTEKLLEIATDIKNHSNTDMEITNIMFFLANECCYTFFDIGE